MNQKTTPQNCQCSAPDDERTIPIHIPLHYINRCNRLAEKNDSSGNLEFYKALNHGLAIRERGEA